MHSLVRPALLHGGLDADDDLVDVARDVDDVEHAWGMAGSEVQ